MGWLTRHIEGRLVQLASGRLSARQVQRVIAHARGCARCGRQYERLMLAIRHAETGSVRAPAPSEAALLEQAGLEAALRAGAPLQPRRWAWWQGLGLASAAAAAAVLLILARPDAPSREWAARGPGAAPGVTLRAFCSRPGQPLQELLADGRCPRGAALAFAAGARAPLTHVALSLRGAGGPLALGAFALDRGAAESALPLTPRLALDPGPAQIVAGFGSGPEQAEAAAREGGRDRSEVLRLPFVVEEETP